MDNKEEESVELKEVPSGSILASVKKESVLILRIDGEDLTEFADSSQFESEVISIFSRIERADASLRKTLTMALEQLTIEHGMPPSSDSLVFDNIIEPALLSLPEDQLEKPHCQDIFLQEFKKLMDIIILRLKEHPVIVAHTENTFDANTIKFLLSNNFELEKFLDTVWRMLSKESSQGEPREQLRFALDWIATSIEFPPYGTNDQVDVILDEIIKMVNTYDKKVMKEEEFKKTINEILESLMLQLEENPVYYSSYSVVHEPIASSKHSHPSSPSSISSQGE